MNESTFNCTRSLRHVRRFMAAIAFAFLAGSLFAQRSDSPASIVADTYARFGLTGGQIVDILPVATASGGLHVSIPIEGEFETIELTPVTVRAADYQVLVQIADGTYEVAEPTPENNFRGTVIGQADSVVAATYDGHGFRGKIVLADGIRYWVEPLTGQVATANDGQHIVYTDEDIATNERTCADPLHAQAPDDVTIESGSVSGTPALYVAQLALDADYEYYLRYGSVAAVQDQINTVINAVNAVYERDVQIRHVISTIIVRSTVSDPYSSTNSDTLLNQFRIHWQSNHASIQRDVAQLFTGKNIDDDIIGIAWLGQICTSMAYGLVESDYSGNSLALQSDLSAHELGHNWNAQHCGCPTYTMNPSITGANRFHPTLSIPSMIAYRDTRACLDFGDELLRITIQSPSDVYDVGQADQLTAVADFRYGPDQIVTPATEWSVDRPEFAFVSPEGLLVLLDAEAESCVTVNASYSFEGVIKTDQLQVTIKDPLQPLALMSSDPSVDAIDARRPTDPNGSNRTGWTSFELTLNSEPCVMDPSRFMLTQVGGTQEPPTIESVTPVSGNVVRVNLNKAIDSGAWTTIEDTLSDVRIRVGFLPGDVNGNGTATPSDIIELIDSLNGLTSLPPWSTDLDRSGLTAPADIITIIDLLNGAGGYAEWNGVSLPEQ